MIITGIEVIRGNHRAERAGPGQPASIEVAPPGKLELTYGDTLRITTAFNYRGPATDITLYGSIGSRRGFPTYDFDEILSNEAPLKTPDSKADFVSVTPSVDIPITANIDPKPDYDIYCKIKEYPGAGMPEVDDVIAITGMPPTFELLEETIYPYAYVYNGPYEGGIFTFKTDPFTPANWIAGRFADLCEDKVKEQGWRVLETKVYVDKSPLLWTDWRIEIKAVAPEGTAVALGGVVAVLVMVLLIILGLIGLIVAATWAWKEIFGTHKAKPIDEEIKQGMSRKWLTLTIGEFEERLIAEGKIPGPPTPPEELEQMSDQELRDYCDQLAELVVPPVPPVPGLGIAIAAVGVLGLGALAAMAMARPAEEGHER